jgi:hypothetical protein
MRKEYDRKGGCPNPYARRRFVVLSAAALAPLVALALLSGCSSDCHPGQDDACDGNSIRTCQSDTSFSGSLFNTSSWHTYPCKAPNPFCVVNETPTCAASPDPVPECSGAPSDTAVPSFCIENAPATCAGEFPKAQGPCEGGPCVATDFACAFCDDGTSAPDPVCASGDNSTCFEGAEFACRCGRRSAMLQDCTSSPKFASRARTSPGTIIIAVRRRLTTTAATPVKNRDLRMVLLVSRRWVSAFLAAGCLAACTGSNAVVAIGQYDAVGAPNEAGEANSDAATRPEHDAAVQEAADDGSPSDDEVGTDANAESDDATMSATAGDDGSAPDADAASDAAGDDANSGSPDGNMAEAGDGGSEVVPTDAATDAPTCTPGGTTASNVDGGSLWACFQSLCGSTIAECSRDCLCNDAVLTALACEANGGGVTACYTPIVSTDDVGIDVIDCLIQQTGICPPVLDAGPDGATTSDASSDVATDAAATEAGADAKTTPDGE